MSKILLVDDDKLLSASLTDELKEAGLEVFQAYDGEEGLAMTKEHKPDLILLDLMMPKKNGFDVLDELKKDDDTKNIPVIILTVSANEDKLEQVLSAGAVDAFIKSNYTLKSITEKVKNQL